VGPTLKRKVALQLKLQNIANQSVPTRCSVAQGSGVFDFNFAAEASSKVVNRFSKQARLIPESLLGGHSLKNFYIANNFSEDIAAISSYIGILNIPITILFSQSRVDALSKQSPAKKRRLKSPTNA
jgi:hypothetical protein